MKIKILAAALLFLAAGEIRAASGPERNVTADPVFSDHGNTWREIAVGISSHVVLISSSPEAAVQRSTPTVAGSLGITAWRFREVVNRSTCSAMAVYSTGGYDQFSTTFGVVLASVTATGKSDGSLMSQHQDAVWAVGEYTRGWPGGGANGAGAGAGGSESYYLLNKKR